MLAATFKTRVGVEITLPRGAEGTTPTDTCGKRLESSTRRLETHSAQQYFQKTTLTGMFLDLTEKNLVDRSVVIARGGRGDRRWRRVKVGKW